MAMPVDHSAVGEVTSNILTYLWADPYLESGIRDMEQTMAMPLDHSAIGEE